MVCDYNTHLRNLNSSLEHSKEVFDAWLTPIDDIAVLNFSPRSIFSRLTKCEGIGLKITENVIEYYIVHGEYQSVDVITQVPGVGKTRRDNILKGFAAVKLEADPQSEAKPQAECEAAPPSSVEGGTFFVHNVQKSLLKPDKVRQCKKHLETAEYPSMGAIIEFNRQAAYEGAHFRQMMDDLGYTLKVHQLIVQNTDGKKKESVCIFFKTDDWKLRESFVLGAKYLDANNIPYYAFARSPVLYLFTRIKDGQDTGAYLLFSTFHLTFTARDRQRELDRLTMLFRAIGLCGPESIPLLAAGDGNGGTAQKVFNPPGFSVTLNPLVASQVKSRNVYDVSLHTMSTEPADRPFLPKGEFLDKILEHYDWDYEKYHDNYSDHYAMKIKIERLKKICPDKVNEFLENLRQRQDGDTNTFIFTKEEVVPSEPAVNQKY